MMNKTVEVVLRVMTILNSPSSLHSSLEKHISKTL